MMSADIEYYCKNYKIFPTGEIFSYSSNIFLKIGAKKNGYYHVNLSRENNSKRFYVHKLVAYYFVENPNQCKFISHLDGNKLNNDSKNLKWVNRTEICLNRNFKTKSLNNVELSDVNMSQIKEHPIHKGYFASIDGLVYSKRKQKIKFIATHVTGDYLAFGIYLNGKRKHTTVHKFVYECFNGLVEKEYVIDHINENKLDNRLENLRKVTPQENTAFSVGISIRVETNDGNIVEFNSLRKCGNYFNTSHGTVRSWLNGAVPRKKFNIKQIKLIEYDNSICEKDK